MKTKFIIFNIVLAACMISQAVRSAPPQPPTDIKVTAGSSSVAVSWVPPLDTGDLPIISYTAIAAPGKKCSVSKNKTGCTITGLKNNNWYTVNVIAKNRDGASKWSAESDKFIPSTKNVNGECGTANNIYNAIVPNKLDLCALGVDNGLILQGDGLYHWTCAGFRQGSTAFCRSAPYTPPKIKVGDKGPAGGKVFYVTPDGYHGMEAAPALQTNKWGCSGSNSKLVGATDTAVGRGEENTKKILLNCPEPDSAARIADNFVLNGYTDWFLPSKDEMGLLAPLTDVAKGEFWTSSELGASTATVWSRDIVFCNGGVGFCWGPFSSKSEYKYPSSFSSYYELMFHPVRAF